MDRNKALKKIKSSFQVHPVVALLGPRQCGKTTLARTFADMRPGEEVHYFDLEDPTVLAQLASPKLILSDLKGLIVIDEIQKRPDLFPVLRVLVDRPGNKQKYLILGSASRDLIRQSSETLAGRIAYSELSPFNFLETGDMSRLWIRGGFPRSYLAKSIRDSVEWRQNYITTFLEQDVPNLGIQIPAVALRRFWMMLAHYHGNIFNASQLGHSLGIADTTVRRYLDILTGTFMVRQLLPWIENLGKRQVKSPKIYFRDSGIYHSLINVPDQKALLRHPALGASWEGIALNEIIGAHQADNGDCYFWGTHNDAELDLLIFKNGKRLGFEIKFTDSPKLTKSMHIALNDLSLDSLTVIFPGEARFPLSEKIEACGLETYLLSMVG